MADYRRHILWRTSSLSSSLSRTSDGALQAGPTPPPPAPASVSGNRLTRPRSSPTYAFVFLRAFTTPRIVSIKKFSVLINAKFFYGVTENRELRTRPQIIRSFHSSAFLPASQLLPLVTGVPFHKLRLLLLTRRYRQASSIFANSLPLCRLLCGIVTTCALVSPWPA